MLRATWNSDAKNTIQPESTTANIIHVPQNPSRPGTARFTMCERVLPEYIGGHRGKSNLSYSFTVAGNNNSDAQQLSVHSSFSMCDFNNLWEVAITQMSAKEGLKRFGEKAQKALLTEWLQRDDLDVYEGVH